MNADEDIRRPVLPATQDEKQEKKGFFGRFSSKKPKEAVEIAMLKEQISADKPQQSIQKDFEKQVSQEDSVPAPPSQTMVEDQAPPTEKEIPTPQNTTKKVGEKAAPTIKGLEEQLQTIKTSTRKNNLITFTIMGGKRAITLQDLKKVIQQMPAEKFKQHHTDKEFSLWIKTHLYDNDLAGKLQEAITKQQAIQAIEEELKPRINLPETPTPPKKHEDHVEEHFSKLQAAHEHSMQELAKAVKQPTTIATKDYLKQALKTKDGKIIDNLNDLVEAIDLLHDETYKNILTTRKEDLAEFIKVLTQRAAQISQLNPAQLQASIVELIRQHVEQINKSITQEKNVISEQANQLLKKEDEILKQETILRDTIANLKKARQRVTQQRETWEQDVKEREEALQTREQEVNELISKQETTIKTLKEEIEAKEQAFKEEEKAIEDKKQQLREEELGIAKKKQQELKDVREEKQELDKQKVLINKLEGDVRAKEDQLIQDKQAYEEGMQKREQIVQDTVDKIINIDEEINDQREKIVEMKHELNNEGFKKYLQRTLRGINTDHIQFKALPEEEDIRKKYVTIYGKIDACNDAIENHQLPEAKQLYAELKQTFEKAPLEQEEKEILYDAIREIYADLHLALLEEQN